MQETDNDYKITIPHYLVLKEKKQNIGSPQAFQENTENLKVYYS